MSAILVYLDRSTNHVIRVSNNTRMVPANLDETKFIYSDTNLMPADILEKNEWNSLEFNFQIGQFKLHNSIIDLPRIKKINTLLVCIERFQGMLNAIRINQSPYQMIGAADIALLYEKEIEEYNVSGIIGPLLTSKINDDTSIEEVITDFTLRQESYKNTLLMTEQILNEYLPKIKSSPTPNIILSELAVKYGANLK